MSGLKKQMLALSQNFYYEGKCKQMKKCVGLCRLDDKKICLGCGRTIEEIKELYEKNIGKKQ